MSPYIVILQKNLTHIGNVGRLSQAWLGAK